MRAICGGSRARGALQRLLHGTARARETEGLRPAAAAPSTATAAPCLDDGLYAVARRDKDEAQQRSRTSIAALQAMKAEGRKAVCVHHTPTNG